MNDAFILGPGSRFVSVYAVARELGSMLPLTLDWIHSLGINTIQGPDGSHAVDLALLEYFLWLQTNDLEDGSVNRQVFLEWIAASAIAYTRIKTHMIKSHLEDALRKLDDAAKKRGPKKLIPRNLNRSKHPYVGGQARKSEDVQTAEALLGPLSNPRPRRRKNPSMRRVQRRTDGVVAVVSPDNMVDPSKTVATELVQL